MSVKIALAAGLVMIAVAVGVVLAQHPTRVLATNSIAPSETLDVTANKSARACQSGERLPRGTHGIRLSIASYTGPRVVIKALSGSRVIASGERGAGWDGQDVTVPIKTISATTYPVTICFATTLIGELVSVLGSKAAKTLSARAGNGERLGGRVSVQYMAPGRSSWLSLAGSVARQLGLGRAWSGTWIAYLVLAMMLTVTVLASRLIVRELNG